MWAGRQKYPWAGHFASLSLSFSVYKVVVCSFIQQTLPEHILWKSLRTRTNSVFAAASPASNSESDAQ